MKNNFLILVCFYNAESFIERCIGSILSQDYKNFRILLIDDASTDNGFDLIDEDEKIIKIKNKENKGLLYSYAHYLPTYANDGDIVVVVDGDDALQGNKSLSYLNDFYNEHKCLVTYGQSIWTDGRKGFARPYTEQEFKNLRRTQFLASHLRTFKYQCFKELMIQDQNFDCFKDKNGDYYMMAGDVATMYPIMEIAGFENVKYIDKILHLYNIHNPISDHMKNQQLQWDINNEINNKKPFKRCF
jgi:glycosyltransferase involved in cell wall biosynthesis